jgi:hypothetical protein
MAGGVLAFFKVKCFAHGEHGWTPASDLRIGERIATATQWVEVEDLQATKEVVFLYNFRITQHHTYFVGKRQLGLGIWVHNSYDGDLGNAPVRTVGDDLASAQSHIGSVPKGKTVAANVEAQRTLSGWTDQPGFVPSAAQVDQVLSHADSIGYAFKRAGGLDKGIPGRYFASHAEPQLSLLSDVFAVSKDMCASCRSFISARAVAEGKSFTIQDPTKVWTFTPTMSSWTKR